MKDRIVRALLIGPNGTWDKSMKNLRVTILRFPAKEKDDIYREIKFPTSDGLILHFLKRIEELEDTVATYKKK